MSDALFDVSGQRVLVTGGLGQIGTEFVKAFASRGATVFVASRSVTAERLADHFGALDGLVPVQFDVTDADGVRGALREISEKHGPINTVINNAGLDTQPSAPPEVSGPFEDFPVEIFREVVDVNLTGTFIVTQAAGAEMRRHEIGGSIINIGSIYGMLSPIQDIYAYRAETGRPFTKPVAYSAAKSGVYNLTRYCATYWGKHGIRVNTITPSGVERETQDAQFQANYTARMPIGRMAHADEFNGAAIFLASDASTYMTGANLVVDGGWTAW